MAVCVCYCADNVGKFRPGFAGKQLDVIRECTLRHEYVHATEHLEPRDCAGVGACGSPKKASTPRHECEAYEKEFKCIADEGKKQCKDDKRCRLDVCLHLQQAFSECETQ